MSPQTFETQWGGKTLTIEVGKVAGQANGACTVRYGDTVVLGTAVLSERKREGIDFFPLMVDFEEKLSAAGIIKSSRFIKREGRPSDEAILSGRLIDRSIRPLFDDKIRNDVQVIVSSLSVDGENDPDVLGLIAASCALAISNIPWDGPIGGIRVGRIASEENPAGEWVINPTYAAREKSMLDVFVAGTPELVTMIEAGAKEATEEVMEEAIAFAQKHLRGALSLIESVVAAVGKKKKEFTVDLDNNPETAPSEEEKTLTLSRAYLQSRIPVVLFGSPKRTKEERLAAVSTLKADLDAHLEEQQIAKEKRAFALSLIKKFVEEEVTRAITEKETRVDARSLTEIRPLSVEVAILPRTHGSALFSRGETQALSTVTLGSPGDVQLLEGIEGSSKKHYMHHYNFPPYSVGETSPMRGPGRREIGHGALAEKALVPVLPPKDEFPYTIRIVSDVMSSNGSSSMASTCGSTLALMDAGVPIKKPVAGIAMGLATGKDGAYKILTDLQDLEDGKGGMDFKIAGTRDGITAIQMDTKTHGLTPEIIKKTLVQARQGRLQILDAMTVAIAAPRAELSQYAPRVETMHIDPEKIRVVIGPGGKMINEIIDKTGVDIDLEDDGTVFITSTSAEGMAKAKKWIEELTHVVKAGEVYDGKVTRLMDFGAFVEILPGQEGLVHISEMAWGHTNRVEDAVKVGDAVKVQVKEIDDMGRTNLSMRALMPKPEGFVEQPHSGFRGGDRPFRGGGRPHGGGGGRRPPRRF